MQESGCFTAKRVDSAKKGWRGGLKKKGERGKRRYERGGGRCDYVVELCLNSVLDLSNW